MLDVGKPILLCLGLACADPAVLGNRHNRRILYLGLVGCLLRGDGDIIHGVIVAETVPAREAQGVALIVVSGFVDGALELLRVTEVIPS